MGNSQSHLIGIETKLTLRNILALGTLNRTLLELKLNNSEEIRDIVQSLNRTLLELKLCSHVRLHQKKHPLNRTLLELKPAMLAKDEIKEALSIAPYWN